MKIALFVFSILLMGTLILSGCSSTGRGGFTMNKEYSIQDFSRVEASGAFIVEIARSDVYSINILADDFSHIRVEKQNGALVLGHKGIDIFAFTRLRPQAIVTMPELYGLVLSGASQAKAQGFNSEHDFVAEASGASTLEISGMSVNNVRVGLSGASKLNGNIQAKGDARFEVSGASNLELAGSAAAAKITVSGASRANLERFEVKNAGISLTGASNSTINVSDKLDAELSGASHLTYTGNPVMGKIETSGASSLTKK